MNKGLIARASVVINAPASSVWDALTNPELIKQYLFGTQVSSDWKVGSSIIYKGTWEDKNFEDKGRILQIEPERLLESTFWSALSGLADVPENYSLIRYDLAPEGSATRVTLTQDNNATAEDAVRADQNWTLVLESMKKLLES
jgi:uncharacterized protein YndB with AHSA1/START domain